MITIELPFPPSILNPNRSKSWQEKMTHRNKYKEDCQSIAEKNCPVFEDGNIPVKIIFHRKDDRHYDLDNALAALKNGIDGVCLAWGINDKRLRPITIDAGEKYSGGKVVLTFGCDSNHH